MKPMQPEHIEITNRRFRVAPRKGAHTSTVAPVDVAHTYGLRHTWISLRGMPPTGIRGFLQNAQMNADL